MAVSNFGQGSAKSLFYSTGLQFTSLSELLFSRPFISKCTAFTNIFFLLLKRNAELKFDMDADR